METPTKMSLRGKQKEKTDELEAKDSVTPSKTPKKTPARKNKQVQKEKILTSKDTSVLHSDSQDEFDLTANEDAIEKEEESEEEFTEPTKKRATEFEEVVPKKRTKETKRRAPKSFISTVEEDIAQVEVQAESIPLKKEQKAARSLRKPQFTPQSTEEQLAKELSQQLPQQKIVEPEGSGLEFSSLSSVVHLAKEREVKEGQFPVVTMEELEKEVEREMNDSIDENDDFITKEPLVRDGVAASVAYLYQRGFLQSSAGSTENFASGKSKSEEYQPSFELTYVDSHGNKLTPKEAYKQLCHRFHGNAPGKQKMEKILKKIEQNKSIEKAQSTKSSIDTSQQLHEKLKESKSAYLVIGK